MQNFNWTQFTRKIPVKASMAVLYNAWTSAAEIEKWFLSKAVFFEAGKAISTHQTIVPGNTYEWEWYGYDAKEGGRILEANGHDRVSFTFAGECIVEIQLSEHNGTTLVTLTQSNIPTDDLSKKDIRLGCATGWSFFLVSLKSVYEGGLDLRNKDESFTGVVNS